MRVIAIGTLKKFFTKHPKTETGIKVWIEKVRKSQWNRPEDILNTFAHARNIGNGRVIFSISKNDYRLVVQVNYNRRSVYVCFVGTHSQYDQIDPETVWNY